MARDGQGEIADLIAEDVRVGRFPPGSWLKQIALQQRYRCGRPDVRKALATLAARRMVEYVPNRGYYVYREDDAAALEICHIRIMLETAAAARMVFGASAARVAAMRTLAQQFDDLLPGGTIFQIYEANLAFHRALLGLTGNRQLVDLVDELRLRTSSASASQWATRGRIAQSSAEHFEMVERLAAGDGDGLARVIARHIRQSGPEPAGPE